MAHHTDGSMHMMLRTPMLFVVPLLSRPSPRMEVTVCTGGACAESGAEMLLDACSALAAGDAKLEVKTAFCSGECPAAHAMLCPKKGSEEAYEASCSTLEDAIASAEAALSTAKVDIQPGLKDAFILSVEAKSAEERGDMEAARDAYTGLLATVPADLLEPCQEPLPSEPIDWDGSKWAEDSFASELNISPPVRASVY